MMKKLLLLVALLATSLNYGQQNLFDGTNAAGYVFYDGFIQTGGTHYTTDVTPSGFVMDDGTGNLVVQVNRAGTAPQAWEYVALNDKVAGQTGFSFAGKTHFRIRMRTNRNTNGTIKAGGWTNAGGSTGPTVAYIGNGDGTNYGPWQFLVFDVSGDPGTWYPRLTIQIDESVDYGATTGKFQFDDFLSGDNTLSTQKKSFSNIKVYPNPVINELRLADYQNIKTVSIHNLLGQKVKQLKADRNIDVSDLTTGVYILKTDTGATSKFVKK